MLVLLKMNDSIKAYCCQYFVYIYKNYPYFSGAIDYEWNQFDKDFRKHVFFMKINISLSFFYL